MRRKLISPITLACMTLCVIAIPAVNATTTAVLPSWVCAHPDAIYVDGFQPAAGITRLPSNGSGGAIGDVTRTVSVPGYPPGTFTIYLHVPPSYSPERPFPLVLALHGQAGSPTAANTQAQVARNTWAPIADANRFIVIAPIATGALGGWNAPGDYQIFAAAIADAEAAYNIERSRRIGWGYSAGGHVLHDIMLNHVGAPVSIDTFAAYGVSAGVLEGLACSNPTTCNTLVATATRRIPLDIHVGNQDSLFPKADSDHNIFLANNWVDNSNLWFTVFVGNHVYTQTHLDRIWKYLCPFQALP